MTSKFGKILRVLGLRAPRATVIPKTAPMGSQARPWSIDDAARLSSRGLSIKKIFRIYADADAGWTREMCDLFDDRIEADAHLRSLLESRLESVTRKPWILLPGGDTEADAEAAEVLMKILREVPGFSQTLEHQGTFNWYGWAATEIDWQMIDGMVVPTYFANLPPQRFRFADADELRLDVAMTSQGEPLRPGKWWVTRRRGKLTAAAGLMRTALIYSHMKSIGIRDWLVYLDRFGIPYVTARYDPQILTEKSEIADLEKALREIGNDGYAIFTTAIEEIVIHQAKSGSTSNESIHEQICNFFDKQISKLVAGATLLMESGGPGSFALGAVHQNRAFDLLLGDAERLGETFAQQVGRPFVQFNNLDARPPRLKFHLVKDSDPAARAKVFDMALRFGLDLDAEQVREELQLKKPTREILSAIEQASQGGEDDSGPGE